MKSTSKTIHSAGQVMDHEHAHHSHGHYQDHDDDHGHEHHDHEHETGPAGYVRLGLMGIIVAASLTSWWRPFMNRDWLAFAGTVIGGFPIYKEAWENFIKCRMTMELSMTIALLSALAIGQIFTAIVIGSHFSDHAQSHRNNRRDHRCCGLRSCGRYAAGNSGRYWKRGSTRNYRERWAVSGEARRY
jgi:cation transport ATPase